MKDASKLPRMLRGCLFFVCCAAACLGCTYSHTQTPGLELPLDSILVEASCLDNLQYLAKMIKEISTSQGATDARLLEAIEIYRMAESLYLQKEFILASELTEDAINRLEEAGE
jgi:hypothetical protein